MDLMAAITGIPGIGPVLPYIIAFVAICSALAPFLRPPANSGGAYATLYGVVNFVALNLGHAKNATAPAAPVASPGKSVLAVLLVAGTMLSGCADPATQAKVMQAATVFCQIDGSAQPIAVPLAAGVATAIVPAAAAPVAGAVAVDQNVVHPALTAACAGLDAKPVAVAPAR